jgi:sortase (surface protein transpeptidase)
MEETARETGVASPAASGASANAHRRAFAVYEAPKVPAPAKEKTKAPPKPASPKPGPSTSTSTAHKPVYAGTNHFWIPSLGMSYGVRNYACGRTSTPGNHIYRWGCAGKNNVYLLGHAWGVMKPLHDLYVRGGLRVGMVALYADGAGRVRKYKVTEWRVVRPTEIAWQIAAQPVPSMTLQTCIGAKSQYRLNVRLVVVK